MLNPKEHPEKLRVKMITLFFSGLFLMAVVALLIGWACGDWGRVQLAWLNLALGPVLTLGGLALVIWSVVIQYSLGRGTPVPKVATQILVTQGPYACSRNPMTLGALMMYLGIGIWMSSGVVIILTMLVFGGLLTYIYVHETRELSERFGEVYLEYIQQTPFLLPRCRKSSTKLDLNQGK